MYHWALLIVAFVFALGCWVTYDETSKQQWWYLPVGIGLGAIVNLIWFYVCKIIPTKQEIYVFNVFWDVVMAAVYYGLPILLFGVKMDRVGLLGVVLVITGLVVLRLRM